MTAALLDPRVAERLCKLLGMLGSHHDGERASAAWKAHELMCQLGLTWADIIVVPADWRTMAQFCRGQAHRLTPREFDFVNNMNLRPCEPTAKQMAWLEVIFSRLGGRA